MPEFAVNTHRFDPYKNFKFRVKWDGRYVAGREQDDRAEADHRGGRATATAATRAAAASRPAGPSTRRSRSSAASRTTPSSSAGRPRVWNLGAGLGAESSLKDFRKDIQIEVYNEAGQKVLAYNVFRCWVSEYQALPDLDANANAIAIQTLKLENEGWERDEAVTEPAEPENAAGMTAAATSPVRRRPARARGRRAGRAPPVERAVAVAARAAPRTRASTEWTVGRRDALLLDVHAAAFGGAIELVTDCPACGEALELSLAPSTTCAARAATRRRARARRPGERRAARLPAAVERRPARGRRASTTSRRRGGRSPSAASACEPRRRAGASCRRAPSRRSPRASPSSTRRPTSSSRWRAPSAGTRGRRRSTSPTTCGARLDARARSLVAEVAALAAAFGWTEGEILGLPADRRRLYLDLVGA